MKDNQSLLETVQSLRIVLLQGHVTRKISQALMSFAAQATDGCPTHPAHTGQDRHNKIMVTYILLESWLKCKQVGPNT